MSSFFKRELNSLEDLFLYEIEDLYDAEKRLIDALPSLVDAASSPALREAFKEHLNQTKEHASRLEHVFADLGRSAERETCDGMNGLVKEALNVVDARGDADVKDAALIGAAQRMEHYEIAGYGTARTFAERLGRSEIARGLQSTLDEEAASDRRLTQLAEESVNVRAQII